MTHRPTLGSRLRGASLLAACAVGLHTSAHAEFTRLDLGPIDSPNGYNSIAFDQLPDGRLIYGTQNALFEQAVFGSTSFSAFQTGGILWDPATVKVFSNTLGAIGGYNTIYTFNPGTLTNTFTAIPGVSLQNFSLVFRDATSLYVGGANGTALNSSAPPYQAPKHAISYVTTDGATTKLLIDNISEYSGDFTTDAQGNLYVTNNDNGGVYRFDKQTQIDEVIAGNRGALHLSDGQLVGAVADTVSLAIDGQQRLFSAGYLNTGFASLDPATGYKGRYLTAGANKNYLVSTFTVGGQEYVSYIDTATTSPGAPITYGYDLVQNVPEPGSAAFLLGGLALLGLRRKLAQG